MFCQRTDVPLTKEHVYPKHWKQYFPAVEGSGRVWQSGMNGYVERRGANHQFDNQVREVCGPCNGGWMQDLDMEAKPLVIAIGQGRQTSMTGEEATLFRSWATKIALVRSLQDRNQGMQALPERFHKFYDDRLPFSDLAVQAGYGEVGATDGNAGLTLPGETASVANVVSGGVGRLFFQAAIYDPADTEHVPLVRRELSEVRYLTGGRMQLVKAGMPWGPSGEVSATEVQMARQPHALIGVAPAIENGLRRVPRNETPGSSFGNPYNVPNINDLAWQRF
ncbi:hypothetical protein BC477_02550 [Clavibacter michiganensis subsp. michiganensis]|uniref:Uncharacterized protein n=1 Tax=Clavibacter michiganensis subsp. michiganensis TaxID=33013 RepID=A0A251XJR7_CLAMM|nr:hypothetical protein BC477_02550 [Clavibacter michiganensis subsp. michiganensis]OUE03590.1 hypothetical protein CMMCAS07_01485 [Clavibacter michiganensis subsp. michiganensis]